MCVFCLLQAHHEARGPVGLPEGRNMSRSSNCSSFWYCTGRLLSWGRGGSSGFVRVTVTGAVGGSGVVSVKLPCCTE